MNPREAFLRSVFRHLERRSIEYCVSRNFETVFTDQPSDVDLLARARDAGGVRAACEEAARESGFVLVHAARYTNHSWIFSHSVTGTLVRIDLDTAIRWRWAHVLSADDVLQERRPADGFAIPSPRHEAAILRTQIAWRGEVPARYANRLAELRAGPVSPAQARRSIAFNALAHPLQCVAGAFSDLRRLLNRCLGAFFGPAGSIPGKCVILAGLDGAGKTTFARALLTHAAAAHQPARYFHWIPSPFRRAEFPWPAQGDRPRLAAQPPGFLAAAFSAARLARNLLLAWLGFVLIVRPLVRRGWLVIIDRYVTNYWLDPASVRYAGPDWWLDWVEPLFPKADALLVLDTDAAALRSRKGELTEPEIAAQQMRLRALPALADTQVDLDASQPVDELVGQALRHLR